MAEEITISYIIKQHIKMRGKTQKEVALEINMNSKTLSGILKRDAVDAKLLLKLAALLDINLNWLSNLYCQNKAASSIERYQIPRMSRSFRDIEYKKIKSILDNCIYENPDNLTKSRKQLKSEIKPRFYLLDVLAPDDYKILVQHERNKEKYYCIKEESSKFANEQMHGGLMVMDENEMLNRIIAMRKEEIL